MADFPVRAANSNLNRADLYLSRTMQVRRGMGQYAHFAPAGNHSHRPHFFTPHGHDTSLFRCSKTHRIWQLYRLDASGKQKTLPFLLSVPCPEFSRPNVRFGVPALAEAGRGAGLAERLENP